MRIPRFTILFTAGILLFAVLGCSASGLLGSKSSKATTTAGTGAPELGTLPPESATGEPGTLAPAGGTEGTPYPSTQPQGTAQPGAPAATPAPGTASPGTSGSAGGEACTSPVCKLKGAFVFGSPVGEGGRNTIDTSSRFGTFRKKVGDVYHGVQFLNSTGTVVVAVADGEVVVAGDDSQSSYGPRPGMYGNLVILKHSLSGFKEPVFTLYAHLSEVSKKVGSDVKAGDQIGLVGSSGSSAGSTLYFEVRYGTNTYDSARNPELWLKLLPAETGAESGALAGVVVDAQGNPVMVTNILVVNQRAAGMGQQRQMYLRTYAEKRLMGLSPWGESFAAANLPEGTYNLAFWYHSKRYDRTVEVQPGTITFVRFTVK